jgi:hypothetical protein
MEPGWTLALRVGKSVKPNFQGSQAKILTWDFIATAGRAPGSRCAKILD